MKHDDFTIDIRDATTSDAAAILEIQKLAFHGQGILYNDFTLPPLLQTLEELVLDFKKHLFLKAMDEGRVVGSIRGRAERETCFISRLIVHPDYQNKGIGKKLMHAVENKFGKALRYELSTGHKSEKNLALYAKLGYREYERKPQSAKVMLICLEKWKP
ncbi:MAG: GNAT family N-acetyltransferase [Betaproteobacteria bacterium]